MSNGVCSYRFGPGSSPLCSEIEGVLWSKPLETLWPLWAYMVPLLSQLNSIVDSLETNLLEMLSSIQAHEGQP